MARDGLLYWAAQDDGTAYKGASGNQGTIIYPSKAVPVGEYTDGTTLFSDGYFLCGKRDGSATSLTTQPEKQSIKILPTEYVSFRLSSKAKITLTGGDKKFAIYSSADEKTTAVYTASSTSAATFTLEAGTYFITSSDATKATNIKTASSKILTVAEPDSD